MNQKQFLQVIHKINEKLLEYRSFLVMLFSILIFVLVNKQITNRFLVVSTYLDKCSRPAFAICVCICVVILVYTLILGIVERKKHIANRTVAIASFFVAIYIFYRLFDDSFVFWGIPPYFSWLDLFAIPFIILWLQKFFCHCGPDPCNPEYTILTDTAIESIEDDVFGYSKAIGTMIDNFDSIDLSKESFSVGIVGEWGQGKSSFLNLFCNSIQEKSIVVRFNPRSVKGADRIQDEFFSILSEELSKYHSGVKRYVRKYAEAINAVDDSWLGKIAGLIASLSPDEQKGLINAAIREINRRIYVIIEDFDRLTAQEIIEVLKLIDSNGDFCNTIFMTAYDKEYVNTILRNYFSLSGNQEYTAKYFNFEYALPMQSSNELKAFFSEYVSQNVKLMENDLLSQKKMLSLWEECSDYVVKNLRSLRHMKRFINLFMSRFPSIKNDVDMKDYIYVTLLRYTDLRTYSALCEGRLLKQGGLLNGSDKILYRSENSKSVLDAIQAKESSIEIFNYLFPDKEGNEGTLSEAYNRARWSDNMQRYFFDYEVATIPYSKGRALFDAEDDIIAFKLIDEYLESGYSQSLSNFLRSRTPSDIGGSGGLRRLLNLITYLNKKDRTYDLDGYMTSLMYVSEFQNFKNAGVITDINQYKDVIDSSMTFMLGYAPLEVGFTCIRMIDALYGVYTSENDIIFSKNELVSKAEWAQKYYYKRWGNSDFSIISSLYASAIKVSPLKGSSGISKPARMELLSMMKLHPMEYARAIVRHSVIEYDGHRKLSMNFLKEFDQSLIFPIDDYSFDDWIHKCIPDSKVQYVLDAIVKNNGAYLQVAALKDVYEESDFDGFYEAVKNDADDRIDASVVSFLGNHRGVDLSILSMETHESVEEVRGSIARLVERGLLPSWYKNLKKTMEPFRVGDFVRLVDDAYLREKPGLFYRNNIFRIVEINNTGDSQESLYKLEDVDNLVKTTDVEAIPIDGVHDKEIYYDPIIAAPIVAPGQEIPSSEKDYSYYLDHLSRSLDEYNRDYASRIKEANCQFVHEVQHYLTDVCHSDDLRVNYDFNIEA